MSSITASWVKCTGDNWCSLNRVNLESANHLGVYVIWQPGARVVKVGQGNIQDRLSKHRTDRKITQHGSNLRVTWAVVNPLYLDGVERYLGDTLNPIEAERFPEARPIAVNTPMVR